MDRPNMEKLLSVQEASEILGVKVSTLYSWIHQGYVPHIKLGRLVKFSESDLSQWVEDKKQEGRIARIPQIQL